MFSAPLTRFVVVLYSFQRTCLFSSAQDSWIFFSVSFFSLWKDSLWICLSRRSMCVLPSLPYLLPSSSDQSVCLHVCPSIKPVCLSLCVSMFPVLFWKSLSSVCSVLLPLCHPSCFPTCFLFPDHPHVFILCHFFSCPLSVCLFVSCHVTGIHV